jgi:uncharacterized membrane protein
MHTGLHALGWGLPKLAIALGAAIFAILIAYSTLVFVIVAIQAAGALAH